MKLRRFFRWLAAAVGLLLLLALLLLVVAYWRSTNDCPALSQSVPGASMKAITYCDYGSPDVVKLVDLPKPAPREDQILVRVRAASLNPLDWHYLHGTPYVMRFGTGLRKPASVRLGIDYAGTVEAVGSNVTRFHAGDEVFGGRRGAFAEYICAFGARSVALKPANISFADAAAVPVAAVTALQGLRGHGHLQRGQKVLINGASGGVGTFAVQLAKHFGAHVTGVCSTRNVALVRSLGADAVINYTREDFSKGADRYDLILDCVGTQPLAGFRRALKPNGTCVLIGGGGPDESPWIGPLARPLQALFLMPFIQQHFVVFMADLNPTDLTMLAGLLKAGTIKSVIDRTYSLAQVPDALRYLEKGHARGKVIINVQ